MVKKLTDELYELIDKNISKKGKHMSNYNKLKSILDNHGKLLSMISNDLLPIKGPLLDDVRQMKSILEVSGHKNKQERTKNE